MKDYNTRIVARDLREHSKVYVIPLGDWHLGDRFCRRDIIQGYLNWVKQRDNAFIILGGDLMNCANKTSTPELFDDLTRPDDAYKMVRAMLEPVKDKILMIIRGNHEEDIYRKVGVDFTDRLAYDLGDIPYKPDGGMVAMWLTCQGKSVVFSVYTTHGWGGPRTIGAKVNKVEELGKAYRADVVILFHDHTANIHFGNAKELPTNLSLRRPMHVRRARIMYVNAGGFVDYGGYIQRKGYAPQDLRTPRIRLEAKRNKEEGWYKDIHGSL